MKKSILVLTSVFLLTISTSVFAGTKLTVKQYETIETNLLVGLESDNLGLKVSCAYFLGELKSDKAVIPLLGMLKSGCTEEERIIAALSLTKIEDEIGIFSVKQRVKFDDSERVQRVCKNFYNSYLMEQSGEVIVEPINIAMEFNGYKLSNFIK